MFSIILVSAFIAAVSSANLYDGQYNIGYPEYENTYYYAPRNLEHHRERRQLGSVYVKSDKTSGAEVKIPFSGNDKHMLSAIGAVGFDANKKLSSATGGIAYDHAKGHGLSLTNTHIPKFGDQITAAGQLNLFRNQDHNVNANAFLTRSMPSIPQVPNFNTYGGSVDYMFKNKVGASLAASHTPLFQKTDYSATGNLNIFRNPTSSLDFNAGVSKSVSPFMRSSSWEPNAGFTFRKFF